MIIEIYNGVQDVKVNGRTCPYNKDLLDDKKLVLEEM